MAKKSIAEIVGTIVEELTPLSSEERKRAVHAAMTLLGEEAIKSPQAIEQHSVEQGLEGLHIRARNWMRQNELSAEQLEHAFLIQSEGVEVLAIPGKNNKERVQNAYILTGISHFLLTGEQRFDDGPARALCERFGIYDSTNHAKYMKDRTEFTGSRDRGWTLTIPGLKTGANLVKEINNRG